MAKKNLNILFMVRSAGFLHYHRSILRALAERGHKIHLIFESEWNKTAEGKKELEDFLHAVKPLTFPYSYAVQRDDLWFRAAVFARKILNYRRFLVVGSRQSEFYLRRERKNLPDFFRILSEKFTLADRIMRISLFGLIFGFVEKIEPSSRRIREDLKKHRPDVLMISPVNFIRMSLEYLKEAKRLGIATAIYVLSWDNLTTKCFISVSPARLFVWNEAQAEEAKEHHNIPREKIRTTGAALFDDWFSLPKPTSREEFCRKHGLDKKLPIVTYLGTSNRLAGDESWLVSLLRQSLDENRLENVQMIVRPHPGNFDIYEKLNFKNTFVIPKYPDLPHTPFSLQLFWDTLRHSEAAIVGVNNSGIIEAILAGKPAIAITTQRYREVQEMTQHFQELVGADVLEFSRPENFAEVITPILRGEDRKIKERENFVKDFIRPRGLTLSAGEVVVDEIESLVREAKYHG